MKKHNQKSQSCKGAPVLITAFMVLLLASPIVVAGNYLDELATEAEATASVSKKSKLSPDEKNELKKMEDILSEKKPSTYKFYARLNKKNKEYAYEEWATDTASEEDRMHHLQKKVMDLYFSQ